MKALYAEVAQYVKLRQAMGYKLRGVHRALIRFVDFLGNSGAQSISTSLALQWSLDPSVSTRTRLTRLSVVRGFARHLRAIDRKSEIPPLRAAGLRYSRPKPYVYSVREIHQIVQAARERQAKRNTLLTYSVVIGLLAVTGMRISEAIALDDDDVDLVAGALRARKAKFRKERCIPITSSTVRALQRYARQRDRAYPTRRDGAFFVSERGYRIRTDRLELEFAHASARVGLRTIGKKHGHGPRLHDMRHTFAVATLVRWYKQGFDVERELPKLCDYLGHKSIASTYWYLSATPKLLELASHRLRPIHEGLLL